MKFGEILEVHYTNSFCVVFKIEEKGQTHFLLMQEEDLR